MILGVCGGDARRDRGDRATPFNNVTAALAGGGDAGIYSKLVIK